MDWWFESPIADSLPGSGHRGWPYNLKLGFPTRPEIHPKDAENPINISLFQRHVLHPS